MKTQNAGSDMDYLSQLLGQQLSIKNLLKYKQQEIDAADCTSSEDEEVFRRDYPHDEEESANAYQEQQVIANLDRKRLQYLNKFDRANIFKGLPQIKLHAFIE